MHCACALERPQIDAKDPNGFSPLHIATLYNQGALVRVLLGRGANARSANNWNDTPLHRAATQGYPEICQLLLEAGADPDFEDWRNKTPADYAKEEFKRPAMKIFREWRKVPRENREDRAVAPAPILLLRICEPLTHTR